MMTERPFPRAANAAVPIISHGTHWEQPGVTRADCTWFAFPSALLSMKCSRQRENKFRYFGFELLAVLGDTKIFAAHGSLRCGK